MFHQKKIQMEKTFLSKAFGLRKMRSLRIDYKDNKIIFKVEKTIEPRKCPICGNRHIVRNGYRERKYLCVPIGHVRTELVVKIRRYKCSHGALCHDFYEHIDFADPGRSYTRRFARYVCGLLHSMTLKDVSLRLGVSWGLVKDIHMRYLKRKYSPVDIRGVSNIGIDEFSVRRGSEFKTIVVDLDSSRIIHVGNGRGADALRTFWNRVRRLGVKIKNVATDMSPAYISSVMHNAPEACHVFDRFHVVRLMNDALDSIRRSVFRTERSVNRRKVLMGTRFLLLRNGKDVFDGKYRTRLENALAMNEPLSKAYYMKEAMAGIWEQTDRDEGEKYLDQWVEQARQSKVCQLLRMSNTIAGFKTGILAWYDCHFSNAKVEGINNKIKVLKRQAYGFNDDKYLRLRLFALHDKTITTILS